MINEHITVSLRMGKKCQKCSRGLIVCCLDNEPGRLSG